jgi:hypothetical protein
MGLDMLTIPYCLDNSLKDGGDAFILTHRPLSIPENYFLYVSNTHFC